MSEHDKDALLEAIRRYADVRAHTAKFPTSANVELERDVTKILLRLLYGEEPSPELVMRMTN